MPEPPFDDSGTTTGFDLAPDPEPECEVSADCLAGELCQWSSCKGPEEDPELFARYDAVHVLSEGWGLVLALPAILLFVRIRAPDRWMRNAVAVLLLPIILAAIFLWTGLGMSYDDNDLPLPWWWGVGFWELFAVGGAFFLHLIVVASIALLRTWQQRW